MKPNWEVYQSNSERRTSRLAVPGGWLYEVAVLGERPHVDFDYPVVARSVLFVPNPAAHDAERSESFFYERRGAMRQAPRLLNREARPRPRE
jgi:hypothetical protein